MTLVKFFFIKAEIVIIYFLYILLLHLQPVILHLAAKAIGSLGPVTKQLLETPDGIGSPAVITAEKCAWTWSVSKHEENKTSSKAS